MRRMKNCISGLKIPYELIFVNDASTDRSLEILKKQAQEDGQIKILTTSRPFGYARCLMAGLKKTKGDAVLYIDADLQDPPELLPEMLEKFREGADVVYTTRLSRAGESRLKLWMTKWGYRLLKFCADVNIPVDSGDFKLLSRRAVEALLKLDEKNPFIKGLISWVGFKQVPIYYHRQPRLAGESHFSIFRSGPIAYYLTGITSFSTLPLTLALVVGFAVSILSFLYLIAVVAMFFLGWNIPGWTALMGVILILGGTQLLTIGFLGLYLGKVYDEVKNRPNTIVESTFGFDEESEPALHPKRGELEELHRPAAPFIA